MSDTNQKTAAPTEASANAPAAGGQVDLTVQDLNTLRTVIDIATQRGAFKANELQAVGTTYNKFRYVPSAGTEGSARPKRTSNTRGSSSNGTTY